ncbi:hypothetical protein HGM15179_003445 [Zosterops borbonicus]|uniref:Uncharacterized protein n=1 Tax=Zosterops borbonicus TaxID=364589 RepID=A0A8K1GR09_9PASS|nr:hypothetical protein HGM15179_003445 [Zosterops borbonicus]
MEGAFTSGRDREMVIKGQWRLPFGQRSGGGFKGRDIAHIHEVTDTGEVPLGVLVILNINHCRLRPAKCGRISLDNVIIPLEGKHNSPQG